MKAAARPLIYDASGRPMVRGQGSFGEPSYYGAGYGRRAAYWRSGIDSVNALLAGSMSTVRGRARDIFQKSPWAATAAGCFVDSAIGTGLRPFPIIEDRILRSEVIDLFDYWSMNECDADGQSTFYGMQELAALEVREVGEAFIRFRDRGEGDGLTVPLQLQLLESEQVDEGKTEVLSTQREVKLGVEFDRMGRRRAYWMFRRHPGDLNYSWGATMGLIERTRVPADQVAHVYQLIRAGQVRGIPPIVVLLGKYKDVTEADDAYLLKQKISAMFAGFVTKPASDSNPIGAVEGDGTGGMGEDEKLAPLEPGILQELLPGEEVTFASPPGGGEDFASWFKQQLRTMATGSGVLYEMMTGDLEGVTYSALRAGVNWHRRAIQRWQANVMVKKFCHPAFRRWYLAAVLAGELKPVKETKDGIPRVRWVSSPGWALIDPDKETKAVERRIRLGLQNRSAMQIEEGMDPEDFDEERERECARADEKELIYDSDPRVTNQSGALQGKAAPKPEPKVLPAGTKVPAKGVPK